MCRAETATCIILRGFYSTMPMKFMKYYDDWRLEDPWNDWRKPDSSLYISNYPALMLALLAKGHDNPLTDHLIVRWTWCMAFSAAYCRGVVGGCYNLPMGVLTASPGVKLVLYSLSSQFQFIKGCIHCCQDPDPATRGALYLSMSRNCKGVVDCQCNRLVSWSFNWVGTVWRFRPWAYHDTDS